MSSLANAGMRSAMPPREPKCKEDIAALDEPKVT
jgi:hypothetical protein